MQLIATTGLSSVRQELVRHLLDLAAEGRGGELVAQLTQLISPQHEDFKDARSVWNGSIDKSPG
jgi:hypothetical protein